MGQRASKPGTMSAELGRQIAHAMIDAGIATNLELAEKTGLSGPTIGRILSGSRDTGVEEYSRIAKALGLSFLDLIVATDEALKLREEDC